MRATLLGSTAALAAVLLIGTACRHAGEYPQTAAGMGVGTYVDHQDKSASQTSAEHNYQADQGVRLEFTNVTTDPVAASPGQQVQLVATYALMAPDAQQHFQVTEDRLVTLNGEKVAPQTSTTVDRTPGTWTSKVSLTLSPTAAKGTCQLQVTASAAEGPSCQLACSFTVE